jgi:subtilase family serine protease
MRVRRLWGVDRWIRLGSCCALSAIAAAPVFAGEWKPIAGSLRHPEAASLMVNRAQPDEPVSFAISLAPRDLSGLKQFADEVSNPGSIYYGQFMTPDEVGLRFGPSQETLDSVLRFLGAQGFSVKDVSRNGFVVTAEGSAAQVEDAFKTRLGYVARPEGGSYYRSNLSALQAPSEFADQVVGVEGIDTSVRFSRRSSSNTTTTLNPATYRAAFSESGLYSAGYGGQGVNIAIANWDGYRLSNVPLFTKANGLPVPAGGAGSNVHVVEVGKGATYGQGACQGEGDLDIQSVLMSAPLANVYVYDDATSDTAAPISTYAKICSDNVADIATESYGWETTNGSSYYGSLWVAAYNLHLSMVAQGITYMAATGDSGTGAFPSKGVRYAYPDIDPNVLQVGGAIATVNASTGALQSEASWGLSGGAGGTGGFDPYDTPAHGFPFNVAPLFQTTTISADTKKYNYRLLPDVVNLAAGSNGWGEQKSPYAGWALVVYYNGGGALFDGTSIASPATAGSLGAVWSDLFGKVTPNSKRSNVRLGRIQDFLYANGASTALFNDVTAGSSIGALPGTSTQATPAKGWDFATGWGSLKFSGLESAFLAAGK